MSGRLQKLKEELAFEVRKNHVLDSELQVVSLPPRTDTDQAPQLFHTNEQTNKDLWVQDCYGDQIIRPQVLNGCPEGQKEEEKEEHRQYHYTA